jgi:predicted alpha/beta-hydrolase family hydrolase
MITRRQRFIISVNKGEVFLSLFEHLSELKVFTGILQEANDELEWYHTAKNRHRICMTIRTSEKQTTQFTLKTRYLSEISFKKHLSALAKKDILIKKARGHYKINETYLK